MGWLPDSGWLTQLRVGSRVANLHHGLAVDASGLARPSRLAAGLEPTAPASGPLDCLFGFLSRR